MCVQNKFKLEGINSANKYCNETDFMFKFDLKSGYHHLDINPSHFQYLSFCWKNVYYSFTVLPFGLSSAPFIFTQLFKPFLKYWRSQGHKIDIYLDDGLGLSSDYSSCKPMSSAIQADLKLAGFLVNKERSIWEPSQSMDWLGFLGYSARYAFYSPIKKG